jgi:molecular chaperone HtpG
VSSKQQGNLKINLPNLIRTLGEYLYSDPNVALRELLQNAHDSCVVAESDAPGGRRSEIHVSADPFERILVVTDNGLGMTTEEVNKFLTVIGSSRTDQVRKRLEELGRKDIADRLIGRFGIGLLSAFIVANRVEFKTLSRQLGSKLVVWECEGGSEYQIAEFENVDGVTGTNVTLNVDPRYIGLLSQKELTRLIRRYADLLRIPIFLDPHPSPVNVMDAPWDHSASLAEYRDFLQERYPTDEILDVIPIDIDEDDGNTKVKGALFVPKQQGLIVREHGDVTIYCHRYFVCDDDSKLLPPWARFVRGIIDTPSLREMASREAVMNDDNFERVQAALGRAILNYLKDRHENNPETFRQIVTSHEVVIKAWAVASDELFDQIKDIILFDTDIGKLTLPEYFKRSQLKKGETNSERPLRAFYFSTPGGPGQHAMLFSAKGLHVIDASHFPNLSLLKKYADTTEGVELHRLDLDARGFIFQPLQHKTRNLRELESAFADLHVDAEVVTFAPDEIPGVLLQEDTDGAKLPELRNLLTDPSLSVTIKSVLQQAIDQAERAGHGGLKKTLYLNADNIIIQKLCQVDLRTSEAMEVARAVYHNALLLSLQGARLALTQKDAKIIFDGINVTLATLMTKMLEVNRLQSELVVFQANAANDSKEAELAKARAGPEARHIVCFFAVPFSHEYDVVHSALQQVLEDAPYFWEVARADRKLFERTVPNNVARWIERAHCYAVDISNCNPNVMMELGQIYWGFPKRPLLLLEREGLKNIIADLGATLRIEYPWNDRITVEEIVPTLRKKIAAFAEVGNIRGERHYLSAHAMRFVKGIDPMATKALAERYTTIEEFLEKSPREVAQALPEYLPHSEIVKIIQESLKLKLQQAVAEL